MCSLVFFHGCWPSRPLLVVANRDEQLDRPASGPRLHDGTLRWLAPVDERAGGTWWGLNERGVFAALTNRYEGRPPDAELRSRGELIPLALQASTAAQAAARVAAHDASDYNPFRLVIADRTRMLLVLPLEGDLVARDRSANALVVTERSHGAAASRRVTELEAWVAELLPGPPPSLDNLGERMAQVDTEDGFEGACVVLPGVNYGTRSSVALAVDEVGLWELRFADGPPHRAEYRPVTEPLRALGLLG